ncbi:MAG: hypothetical protein Q7R49_03050 [Candidatus Daviesbacteria bacterium]|nr:hypothetical protein [Candidatus Daviesbacteria bacterium]
MLKHIETPKNLIHDPVLDKVLDRVKTGQEAVEQTVDFVRLALEKHYPQVKKPSQDGTRIEDRLITSTAQMHQVSVDKLQELEEEDKPATDVLLFTLLKESGIPENKLRSLMYGAVEELRYHRQSASGSSIYLAEGHFNGFSSNSLKDRFLAQFGLGMALIPTNLRLSVKPVDLEGDLKNKVLGWIKTNSEVLLETLESAYSSEVSVNNTEIPTETDNTVKVPNIELARAGFLGLFEGREGYQPRVIASGARLALVLPHQNLITAEIATGVNFEQNIYYYLCEPVINTFFNLLATEYSIASRDKDKIIRGYVTPDFYSRIENIKPTLFRLGLKNPSLVFDANKNSDFAEIYSKAKHHQINTEKYPS